MTNIYEQRSETSYQQFLEIEREYEGLIHATPLERLRFFCSIALNGQDWLDSGKFFTELEQQIKSNYHDC